MTKVAKSDPEFSHVIKNIKKEIKGEEQKADGLESELIAVVDDDGNIIINSELVPDTIEEIIERVWFRSFKQQLTKQQFVEMMVSYLSAIIETSPFYMLIISSTKIFKCLKHMNLYGKELGKQINWIHFDKDGQQIVEPYTIYVFRGGSIDLRTTSDASIEWGFNHGVRTGRNLQFVKWIPKSVKHSDLYGTSTKGVDMETEKTMMSVTKLDIYSRHHIYGIKFWLENGDFIMFGIERDICDTFRFRGEDYLMGVTLRYKERINSIRFRTYYGEFTHCYGNDTGELVDISFNAPLDQVSGYISDRGIESIRFHWS